MSLPAFTAAGQGGTAVLLLHGIGGGRSIWSDAASGTVAALAQAGYQAVAIDLPGYGDSAGSPDMDSMVQAVLDTAAHVGAADTVLLGHSMGGMVAQEVAARHPQHVQGLILACTSASFGKADGAWQAQFIGERLAPLDAGLGMAGMAQKLVPGMMSPRAPKAALRVSTDLALDLSMDLSMDLALDLALDVMTRVPEATYRTALRAIAGFDRRAALASIAVPTLLLAAEHDRTAPPDVMQRMATRIPGSTWVCLPGAGHIANLEAPAPFNKAVLAFLQRHFPPH